MKRSIKITTIVIALIAALLVITKLQKSPVESQQDQSPTEATPTNDTITPQEKPAQEPAPSIAATAPSTTTSIAEPAPKKEPTPKKIASKSTPLAAQTPTKHATKTPKNTKKSQKKPTAQQSRIPTKTAPIVANPVFEPHKESIATKVANKYKYKHNFYAGVDVMHVYAKHKYLAISIDDDLIEINGITSSDEGTGVGANLGYKFSINRAFIAPEVFYEYFKSKAGDFGVDQSPQVTGNELRINQRYGTKINVGYNILPRTSVFASAGLSGVNYMINLYSTNHTENATKSFQPVYGAGVAVDINDNWQVKASYDWQQFTILYNHVPGNDIEKDRILLQTVKLGTVYNF